MRRTDQLPGERRRVGEIEHPGAASGDRYQQPEEMRRALAPQRLKRPRRFVEPHARVAVALEKALYRNHQVGPHRLRAGVAAPHAPGDRGNEKERKPGQHEKAGDVVEFLRPDLQEEKEKAPRGKVDQNGLVGKIGTPIPTDPRHEVINRQRHRHDDPFDAAERAMRALRIDLDPGRIKRRFGRLTVGASLRSMPGAASVMPTILAWPTPAAPSTKSCMFRLKIVAKARLLAPA